jgi:hypothetical protein
LIPDLPLLNHVAAQRAVDVFDRLRLPDVTGKPLLKDIKRRGGRLVPGYRSRASTDDASRKVRLNRLVREF